MYPLFLRLGLAVLDGGEEPGNDREKKCQARQRQRAKALIREVMMLRRWITVAVSLAMTGTVAHHVCTVQYHCIVRHQRKVIGDSIETS